MGKAHFSLGGPSSLFHPPPIQWCIQGLCGEALGKRGPLSSIHLAGGLCHARPTGLSFLGGARQPPPPLMAAPQFHHFLEPQGFGCDPSQKMVGSPTSHTSSFTHWHQTCGNAGQQLGTGARLSPQPTDLREGMRNRAFPQGWESSALTVDLGTNKACKLGSSRPFLGNLLTGMYSGSP